MHGFIHSVRMNCTGEYCVHGFTLMRMNCTGEYCMHGFTLSENELHWRVLHE